MLNYVKDEASIRYDIHSVQSLYDDDDDGGGDTSMICICLETAYLLTYLLTYLLVWPSSSALVSLKSSFTFTKPRW